MRTTPPLHSVPSLFPLFWPFRGEEILYLQLASLGGGEPLATLATTGLPRARDARSQYDGGPQPPGTELQGRPGAYWRLAAPFGWALPEGALVGPAPAGLLAMASLLRSLCGFGSISSHQTTHTAHEGSCTKGPRDPLPRDREGEELSKGEGF